MVTLTQTLVTGLNQEAAHAMVTVSNNNLRMVEITETERTKRNQTSEVHRTIRTVAGDVCRYAAVVALGVTVLLYARDRLTGLQFFGLLSAVGAGLGGTAAALRRRDRRIQEAEPAQPEPEAGALSCAPGSGATRAN